MQNQSSFCLSKSMKEGDNLKEILKNSNFYRNFVTQNSFGKFLYILLLIFLISILLLLSYFSVGSIMKPFVEIFSKESHPAIYYGISTMLGNILSWLLFLILVISIVFTLFKNRRTNEVVSTDSRGISYMKNGTEGTSKWLSKEEASEVFNIFDIADINNPKDAEIDYNTSIYGQFGSDGKEVCGFKKPKFGGEGDRNTFIIGSPGTGKSYSYVRTELIQTVRRGHSFVVTDPSGELYSSLAQYCKDNEYDIKVLNLAEPEYSDFWDCLEETLNPDTQRLDASRLNEFISIYMENTQDLNAPKDFWYVSACNILRAIIGFASWKRELGLITNFRLLYQHIVSTEIDSLIKQQNNELIRDMDAKNRIGLIEIKEQIKKAAIKYNYSIEEVDKLIREIEEKSSPFNIGIVFNYILEADDVLKDANFEEIPSWHPAKTAYSIYKSNTSASVQGSAIQGTQNRLQIFSDPTIKDVLSYEGIHLNRLNATKSAYFIIMSDKSNATKSISSLFFSFLFKDTQECWDKAQQKANSVEGGSNPLLPVTVMLDEFFSIGVIGGDKDQFAVTMSNSRKRRLYISIIVQSYLQPESLYGHANATTIQNCCGTIIFLGCNDPETAKFISEFASGDATVMNESHREKDGFIAYQTTPDIGISTVKRSLLTVDEVRRWRNKVLVVKAGTHPLELNPFPWSDHPDAAKMKPTNIYQSITRISDRKKALQLTDIELEKIKEQESSAVSEIVTKIKELRQCDPSINREYLSKYSKTTSITKKNDNVFSEDYELENTVEQKDSTKENNIFSNYLNKIKNFISPTYDELENNQNSKEETTQNSNTLADLDNLTIETLSENESNYPLIDMNINECTSASNIKPIVDLNDIEQKNDNSPSNDTENHTNITNKKTDDDSSPNKPINNGINSEVEFSYKNSLYETNIFGEKQIEVPIKKNQSKKSSKNKDKKDIRVTSNVAKQLENRKHDSKFNQRNKDRFN